MFVWFVLVIMVLMGAADIYLMVVGRDTISRRYHRLFPQWVDLIVMMIVLAAIWIFLGTVVFTPVMAGAILGHLAWHGDN